jgi:hypothetical protein
LGFAADGFFGRGNAAYEAGSYPQAAALYDSAVREKPTAAAYFNRGNALFKQGQVGRAIADYNRAWVLSPADRDIRHNLAFARQYRPDKQLLLDNPLQKLLTAALRLADSASTRVLAGVMFLVALGLSGLALWRSSRILGWLTLPAGFVFLYFLGATVSWSSVTSGTRAVVVVPELVLRSGPGAEYKDIVVVHDGLEVVIREARPGYVLVQMPGGEGGWAETAAIERIFSR